MRLGLASLLVALSSILLANPLCTLAVTPPTDDEEIYLQYHHAHGYSVPTNTTTFRDDDDNFNTIDGTFDYEKRAKEKPTTRDLKTETEPSYKLKTLTMGYLTAVRGEMPERQGLQISGAITMALDEVSNFIFLLHT